MDFWIVIILMVKRRLLHGQEKEVYGDGDGMAMRI